MNDLQVLEYFDGVLKTLNSDDDGYCLVIWYKDSTGQWLAAIEREHLATDRVSTVDWAAGATIPHALVQLVQVWKARTNE